MCLAIPAQIIEIAQEIGIINIDGVKKKASLMLIENPQIGDYVIVHAGFAIQKIDKKAAKESLEMLRQIASQISSNNH